MNPLDTPMYRRAVAQAIEFEKTMAKINAILGSTETPAWVLPELNERMRTATVPVPGDGHADRYLRTMYPEEAADAVLAAIMAGELPRGER